MNSVILTNDSNEITDLKILNHLHHTLKLAINDTIRVTRLNRDRQLARVVELTPNLCRLALIQEEKFSRPWIDLIVGVSRPQTMKKILEHGATYGIGNFYFYRAALSEKSYLDSKIFEKESVEELLRLGLSQSALYFKEPIVHQHKYNPAKKFETIEQKFILDLEGDKSFADYKIDFNKPIVISIGPERGFITEDLVRFKEAGFKSVKVSESVLRVEHATYSALAQLEILKKMEKIQ